MAFDEGLAQRIRDQLDDQRDVIEKRMFGGIAFMVRGHMVAGVIKDDLLLRVGPDAHAELVARPHAKVMTFTGKPMKGLILVEPDGLRSEKALRDWMTRALAFTATLPPK